MITQIERVCLNCGKRFYLFKGKFNAEIKRRKKDKKRKDRPSLACCFCSRDCAKEHRAKDTRETHICLACGKEFEFLKANNKNGRHPGKYCSRTCMAMGREKPESWEVKICVKCGKSFKARKIYNQQYCSMQCLGHYKHNIQKQCIICDKIFYITASRLNNAICCSVECQKVWQKLYRRKSPLNQNNRLQTKEWRRIRRQALLRDHYTCQYCGATEQLSIHHIIYLGELKTAIIQTI